MSWGFAAAAGVAFFGSMVNVALKSGIWRGVAYGIAITAAYTIGRLS